MARPWGRVHGSWAGRCCRRPCQPRALYAQALWPPSSHGRWAATQPGPGCDAAAVAPARPASQDSTGAASRDSTGAAGKGSTDPSAPSLLGQHRPGSNGGTAAASRGGVQGLACFDCMPSRPLPPAVAPCRMLCRPASFPAASHDSCGCQCRVAPARGACNLCAAGLRQGGAAAAQPAGHPCPAAYITNAQPAWHPMAQPAWHQRLSSVHH